MRRGVDRPRYGARDRALLSALSRVLSRDRWSAFTVTPETLMRWHRRMVRRRWTYGPRPPGRPRLNPELVALIVRLARENASWGSRRIVGELKKLGYSVSETSVRNLVRGRESVPRRADAGRVQVQALVEIFKARTRADDVQIEVAERCPARPGGRSGQRNRLCS